MKPPKIDPTSEAHLRQQAKCALRHRLKALRCALPTSAVAERSRRIVGRLLVHPWLAAAQSVALYAAIHEQREPDLSALHHSLLARGVRLYYPYMERTTQGFTTGFRLLREGDVLTTQGHRFAEPCPAAPIANRGDVDVVVVPALGISAGGHRLGMGSGFYDATLPDLCPPAKSIVIGYSFQLLVELPLESHDRPCDDVVVN